LNLTNQRQQICGELIGAALAGGRPACGSLCRPYIAFGSPIISWTLGLSDTFKVFHAQRLKPAECQINTAL
jgi:hypothetical protein